MRTGISTVSDPRAATHVFITSSRAPEPLVRSSRQ